MSYLRDLKFFVYFSIMRKRSPISFGVNRELCANHKLSRNCK